MRKIKIIYCNCHLFALLLWLRDFRRQWMVGMFIKEFPFIHLGVITKRGNLIHMCHGEKGLLYPFWFKGTVYIVSRRKIFEFHREWNVLNI